MIAIIDYGMGNLRSVQKGLEKVGFEAVVTSDKEVIAQAPGVILPGVGAFADAMENLKKAELIDVIHDVVQKNTPFLGICLGLQLMFTESEENGLFQGLDIFKGRVRRFPEMNLKVPHMGWNRIAIQKECPILKGIPEGSDFYFVHSYYVDPDESAIITTMTDYGMDFPSIVSQNKIFGIQFHPEKSSELGLRILKNFGELVQQA